MPAVSVIVPVYNTEKYLPKCLDSLTGQTLSDIEIICINDCSPDNSLAVLQEYAKKDNRIKIIDFKENKGAAVARNAGIDTATGEYIGFVDSDDYVDPDFYEKLYAKAKETSADVVKGNYFYTQGRFINYYINKKIKDDKHCFSMEYCSCIFLKTLLQCYAIRFPELIEMEDPLFSTLCALKSKKISVVNGACINIVARNNSITRSKITEQRLKDKIKGLNLIIDLLNNNNVSEDSYGYVTAVWFGGIFNNLNSLDGFDRESFKTACIDIYRNIKYKNQFLYYLKKFLPFVASLIEQDKLNDIFFYDMLKELEERNHSIKELQVSNSLLDKERLRVLNEILPDRYNEKKFEDIYFISVVNDYAMFDRCIKENPYIKYNSNIKLIDFDNTKDNVYIPVRYNSFLDNYDYSKEAWFVFCHCDWELMDNISDTLANLDKNCIYGPIGSICVSAGNKVGRLLTGFCYERRKDGTGFRCMGFLKSGVEPTDTFDCQCIIVHSSLVKKFGLRFDEKLKWDLYAEDFSLAAKTTCGVRSYALFLPACHWSGYHVVTPDSYYESLRYVNSKYPNDVYAGTVSYVGGKNFEIMSDKELIFYKLRNNRK